MVESAQIALQDGGSSVNGGEMRNRRLERQRGGSPRLRGLLISWHVLSDPPHLLVVTRRPKDGQMTTTRKARSYRSVSSGIEMIIIGAKLREVGVK